MISRIVKRDGKIVDFKLDKITTAIYKALKATDRDDYELAEKLGGEALLILEKRYGEENIPSVEDIQDVVEYVLVDSKLYETAKAYILYRQKHKELRELKKLLDPAGLIEAYLYQSDWLVRENSNMSFSLQGLNSYIVKKVVSEYWLTKIYPKEITQAHRSGDFHIHDLDFLGAYCVGWDIEDLLLTGFGGVSGKIESRPAKHFRAALGQCVNFFFTLQGESAGAQAFSNFDTYLSPFIRYDNMDYKQVKQALQEFLFNMNVPTRVGFQCMSEDTEILGRDGWKKYNEVREGDTIVTFNVDGGFLEYLPVKHVFAREYKGKMYNLKNRISDQLISPDHRIVRRKFNSERYVLEKVEDVLKLKSPFMVPIGSGGNIKGDVSISEDVIKLIAWVISEGSLDKSGRGDGRISIYQSKVKSPYEYEEIIAICHNLGLKYTERTQQGLGDDCNIIRFDADSTRKILNYFDSNKERGIKFIPDIILNADTESSRLFIETYIQGDGYEGCKIVTTSEAIRDGLLQVIVNAGYGATVLVRKPDNELSKKDRFIIRVIKHRDTYINKIKEVEYEGIIWCPNTENETVIARRNGKIFITGNTPFTNITLDLKIPDFMKHKAVIIGGKLQDAGYGEFQKEMDMFNRAFAEVMAEGDAKGRPFTFPIPTYNITKDFEWDNENYIPMWEMTRKYGIPYFSNFVNSDMKPEDARSMCCRLRLDLKQLAKRGGGLFGSNPLTGSIGVVTINMPRIAYLSGTEREFFERLEKLMEIAKESLIIKRKIIEKLTDTGLYPYSRHYLREIKKRFGEYWKNHFSTIGLIGMNEACLNFEPCKCTVGDEKGRKFALRVFDFMREKLLKFQEEEGDNYNLEATPAEGTSYSLALLDKERFPDIISQGSGSGVFYTNSSQLPVNWSDDIFEVLDSQDEIQCKYTGGTVIHIFLGESLTDYRSVKNLTRKVINNYKLPYFTITPTFSICPIHGYISGEHTTCPICEEEKKVKIKAEIQKLKDQLEQMKEEK